MMRIPRLTRGWLDEPFFGAWRGYGKDAEKAAAAENAAASAEAEEIAPETKPKAAVDIDIDPDDDYEEFTPVDT